MARSKRKSKSAKTQSQSQNNPGLSSNAPHYQINIKGSQGIVIGDKASANIGASDRWLWDNYGENVARQVGPQISTHWMQTDWLEAEKRYRERMIELHGYTRLLGNPKMIKIDDIYTDVYVLDKPTAFRRYDITELQKKPFDREQLRLEGKRQPIQRLAVDEKRLFILGKPGAGKTTFLKYLTLQACKEPALPTPIFVSLKEWADSGLELLPFMAQWFDICDFPDAEAFIKQLLKDGAAWVLFDGLDEVNAEGEIRTKLLQTLTQFSKKYHQAQIAITCRIAAVDYSFTDFTYVEIADFDQGQQRRFAEKWYQDDPRTRQCFLDGFEKPENKGFRELAQTPLLMALLCLAFDELMTFPQRRVDLYQEALEALLKKWDSSRGIKRDDIYRELSLKRKVQMLAYVAAKNFEAGAYFIRKETLVDQICTYMRSLPSENLSEEPDDDIVLKAIEAQHGILVERAHGIYSFSHLTFHEYFTARYVVDNGDVPLQRLIDLHATDRTWREVFLLTASMLNNADLFFELFLKRLARWPEENPWLGEWLQWAKKNALLTTCPKAAACYILLSIGINLALARGLSFPRDRDFFQGEIRIRARVLAYALDLALDRIHAIDLARDIDLGIDLGIDLDSDIDLILDLDIALDRIRDITRDFDFDLDIDLGIARDLGIDLALDRIRTLDLDSIRTLDLDLARDRFRNIARDLGRIRTLDRIRSLDHICYIANELDQSMFYDIDLARDLALAHDLAKILNIDLDDYSKLGHKLEDEAIVVLIQYLEASKFLIDCLQLAAVTDRDGIELACASGGMP